mmetsp:Transcript_8064/g.14133  ORF Transcript_8064/g.14133 Transcript_8064/m.14133 type:complete len:430 (+) Transcript_8064:144-1433(+)
MEAESESQRIISSVVDTTDNGGDGKDDREPNATSNETAPNDDVIDILSDEEDENANDHPSIPDTTIQKLPKPWRKCMTSKQKKIKDPTIPDFFYFNTVSGEVSWVPPFPDAIGHVTVSKYIKPVGVPKELLGKGKEKNAPSVLGHFHCVRAPEQSLDEFLSGDCEPEKTADDPISIQDDDEDDPNEEGLTEIEKIKRSVFNSEIPEKLYMKKGMEPSFPAKAKALGIVGVDKMKKPALEEAVMAYFIQALGSAELYNAAMSQRRTKKHSERKEFPSAKRKREFAEAASEEEVDGTPSNARRKFITPEFAKETWGHKGIYLISMMDGEDEIKCLCHSKTLYGDISYFRRHFRQKCHTNYEKRVEKEKVQQARLKTIAEKEAAEEKERLSLKGTRAVQAVLLQKRPSVSLGRLHGRQHFRPRQNLNLNAPL